MSRYIDADAIKEKIDDIWDGRPLSFLGARILAMIDDAQSIDIVRCKECKHSKPTKYANGNLHCSWHYRSNMPDDFCSYGERSRR